jgi:hypothetical protein
MDTATAARDRRSGTIPGRNPRRNGLFLVDPETCGLVGLDGGTGMDRTANSLSLRSRNYRKCLHGYTTLECG